MKLAEYLGSRDNNFNFLRLLAATAVIYSHSWAFSLGSNTEPLGLRWGRTPSDVAVDAFFIISGLLVSHSWLRQHSLVAFVKARVFRIFPALLVVLLLSIFVVGPVFTTLSLEEYFSMKTTWKYLYNNFFMIHTEYNLPGVFLQNPHNQAINGSLWTLQFELKMYVAVAIAGLMGAFRDARTQWILIAVYVIWYSSNLIMHLLHPEVSANTPMMRVSLCFFLGVLARLLADRIAISLVVMVAILSIAIFLRTTVLTNVLYSVALVYVVLYLAYVPAGSIRLFNRLGDYSYGTYVFAFPIQQILTSYTTSWHPLELFIVGTALTWAAAIASWHLCEKPALVYLKKTS